MALIIGCSNAKTIAKKVAKLGGFDYAESETHVFADGETKFILDKKSNPSGKNVIIIQSGLPDVNKSIMEVCQAVDVARFNGARKVIVFYTYLPYGRQDKRIYKGDNEGFQPNTLKLASKMMQFSGANLLMVLDVHPMDTFNKVKKLLYLNTVNIPVGKALVDEILRRNEFVNDKNELEYGKVVLCAPDAGAKSRIDQIAEQILEEHGVKMETTELEKKRDSKSQETEIISLKGMKPEGKNVLIVDDMICTGGTMKNAAVDLKNRGARKVFAAATHGIFVDPKKPPEKRVFNDEDVINAISGKMTDWIVSDSIENTARAEVEVAGIVADAIKRL